MRIVIDMQGAQTESRLRGIGRYTLGLVKGIVRNRAEHEIILLLNGMLPEAIDSLRATFTESLPPENIRVWYAPVPLSYMTPNSECNRAIASAIYASLLDNLNPDVLLITSMMEGWGDDFGTHLVGSGPFALKEFKLDASAEMNVGDVIKADTFAAGDKVDVVGTSKGHGYQGVVKRWNAGRTPMTHGGGPVHRHAGSMGSSSDPSRIFKGKIGAGQMGVEQVTIQNLDVVKVDSELNMLVIRGAIPGPKGGLVFVKSTVKNNKIKRGDAGISKNPQKASGRNPQKASARG